MLYIITTKYCIFNVLYYKTNDYGDIRSFLVVMAVISGGLVVWSYTKSGKKWLNSL